MFDFLQFLDDGVKFCVDALKIPAHIALWFQLFPDYSRIRILFWRCHRFLRFFVQMALDSFYSLENMPQMTEAEHGALLARNRQRTSDVPPEDIGPHFTPRPPEMESWRLDGADTPMPPEPKTSNHVGPRLNPRPLDLERWRLDNAYKPKTEPPAAPPATHPTSDPTRSPDGTDQKAPGTTEAPKPKPSPAKDDPHTGDHTDPSPDWGDK